MSGADLPDRLEPLLYECVSRHGMDLEEVELTPAGKRRVLRVAVDQDGGVTLDDVAEVTRSLSSALDTADVMGKQPYTLEVTSRGTDRPLTRPRHWRRNTDRLVHVAFVDGGDVEGRIRSATDDGAVVETASGPTDIAYADVQKARIEVELNRKDG
ncbi:MAG: ribosome maturation factor RimP [Nocardioidaceae bacterium]